MRHARSLAGMFAALLLVVGCGSDQNSQEEPVVVIDNNGAEDAGSDGAGSGDTGGSSEDADSSGEDAAGEDAAGEDAADGEELEPRTESGSSWSEGLTCKSACEERGWICDDDPERGGSARYKRTNDDGTFTSYEQVDIESCDQPIEETHDPWETGRYYTLESYRCPCLAEPVTRIEVDINNLQSCEDACADESLACQPETPWTLGQESGGEAEYASDDGASRYHPHGCTEIPPAEVSRGGRIYSLVAYRCGCQ